MDIMYYIKMLSYIFLLTAHLFSTHSHSSVESPAFSVYDIAKSNQQLLEIGDELIIYDEQIFFSGSDQGLGYELWSLDLASGDSLIKQDINLGIGSSSPEHFVIYQGKLYFSAYTKETGKELWVYDNSNQTASLVADLIEGKDESGMPLGSAPLALTTHNDKIYFWRSSDVLHKKELWYFDAKDGSVSQLGNVTLSFKSDEGDSYLPRMISFEQDLFVFRQTTSSTVDAFKLSEDANSLESIQVSQLEQMLNENHVDLDDGLISISNNSFGFDRYNKESNEYTSYLTSFNEDTLTPNELTVSGKNIIFSAFDESVGTELFSYNIETFETTLVADISTSTIGYPYSHSSFPREFIQQNGFIYFLTGEYNENEIWRLDTSTFEVSRISKLHDVSTTSSYPSIKVVFDQDIYFAAKSDGNAQIWKYDLESDTVIQVSTFENAVSIGGLTVFDNRLFFTMRSSHDMANVWEFDKSDNSFTSITNYENVRVNWIDLITVLNQELYFTVHLQQERPEIWSYSPSTQSLSKLTDFTQKDGWITELTKYRNSLYFRFSNSSSKGELWFLYSINKNYGVVTTSQNISFELVEDLIVWDEKLYFTHDKDTYVSYYDNVLNRFSEINVAMPTDYDALGKAYSNVKLNLAYEDKLFFVDRHQFGLGNEPYYLSKSSQEYNLVADLVPGFCCEDDPWSEFMRGSRPSNFYEYDDVLYFNTDEVTTHFSIYNNNVNQNTLWHMSLNTDELNNPTTIDSSTFFDSFKDVQGIIAYKGALYATADSIKDGVALGYELIKLDINVTPNIVINTPAEVTEGQTVLLDASGSTDEDGDQLIFNWRQTVGGSVNIIDSDKNVASFVAPNHSDTLLTFELAVSDGIKQTNQFFDLKVKANSPPVIELIDLITEINEASKQTFAVSVNDAEGDDVSLTWKQVSGPTLTITTIDNHSVSIQFPEVNTDSSVEIRLSATDQFSEVNKTFVIKIKNQIEVVDPVDKSKSGGAVNLFMLLLITILFASARKRY